MAIETLASVIIEYGCCFNGYFKYITRNFTIAITCVVLYTVRVQCQLVTLVPIYGYPTEKFIRRHTYTHAGAEQQCARYNLTLAKRDQPSVRYNDNCIRKFGRKILTLSKLQGHHTWLGDCPPGGCKYLYSNLPSYTSFHQAKTRNHRAASTIALCQGESSSPAYLLYKIHS